MAATLATVSGDYHHNWVYSYLLVDTAVTLTSGVILHIAHQPLIGIK